MILPCQSGDRPPGGPRRRGPLVALGAALLLGGCAGSDAGGPGGDASAAATWVGRESCRSCHAEETAAWEGSHHDLALDVAVDSTVIGDFEDASFTQHGITHRFFRRDGGYWVETEGPGGSMTEYPVTHVIGVEPLQQYLTPFPGGRLQTLPTTWDARPASLGGQRWFHIYGEERIPPEDRLFWAGINQNWNYQCAECHSTDLRKNFRLGTDSFDTTYEEIDVSCEACHGPGSLHVSRAEGAQGADDAYTASDGDFPARLSAANPGSWTWDGVAGKPVRSAPSGPTDQIDTCARCHARRGLETLDYEFGVSLLDTHRPSLPAPPLYFPDGQILDEVYVYGSFLQSRMYQAGVLCSDCHDPHSNQLLAPGPEVCARCHSPAVYGGPEHDFHPRPEPGTAGEGSDEGGSPAGEPVRVTLDPVTWRGGAAPSCLDCHMQERVYMGVDARGDHSFRIPRPDAAAVTGAPDACTACHDDQTPSWAARTVAEWYGSAGAHTRPHYGEALANAARRGPSWPQGLTALLDDPTTPAVIRATAVEALMDAHPRHLLGRFSRLAADPDPFVRRAAMEASVILLPEDRVPIVGPGLSDPVRGVRTAAARSLAGSAEGALSPDLLSVFESAEQEWIEGQFAMVEQPVIQVNLATFYAQKGRGAEAEAALDRALAMDSTLTSAWANLADLYRVLGREGEALAALEQGIRLSLEPAPLIHSRGLARIRTGQRDEAVGDLQRAVELAPDVARYAYVLAVGLMELRGPPQARAALAQALQQNPGDRDLLLLATAWARDAGAMDEARGYARRLTEADPGDPDVQRLMLELGAGD